MICSTATVYVCFDKHFFPTSLQWLLLKKETNIWEGREKDIDQLYLIFSQVSGVKNQKLNIAWWQHICLEVIL